MSRAALSLPLVAALLGAAPSTPGTAPDSPEAKTPAPRVPAPQPFQKAQGFSDAELAPYRDVLGAADLAGLVKLSQQVFAARPFESLRQIAASIAEGRVRDETYAQEFAEDDVLFTYSLPNDPMLLLGTGKSHGGKVTSLPRLLTGVLDKKPKAPQTAAPVSPSDASGESEESEIVENFLLRNPEQVCTAGLSYTLNPDGSGFSGIEFMPPPLPMDDPMMRILLFIESNPSPISLTEEAGDVQSPPAETAAAPAAAEDAQAAEPGPFFGTGALGDVLKRASKGEVPIKEVVAVFSDKTAAMYLSGGHLQKLPALIQALADEAPALKKDCLGGGNTWTEFKQLKDELNLIGCFTPKGQRIGFGASAKGDAFPWAGEYTLHVFDPRSELGVQVAIDASEMLIRLSALKGDKPVKFGPELTFDPRGPALALNFLVPDDFKGKWGEFDVYEWYPAGSVKFIGHRKGGVPVDERAYYESGSLNGHVTYQDGKLTSYREWYEARTPAEETFFDKDGSIHGVRRWWHPNARQAGEITYEHGRPDGDMVMWYDNGKTGVRVAYKKGELNGDVAWAYDDGGKLYEGRFKNDKPDGVVRIMLANGVTVSERTYRGGEPEGSWLTFDAEGKPAQEFSFKKGQKEGRGVVKYHDGQVAVELFWKEGQLDGPLNSYYQNGQAAAVCNYEKDRLTSFKRFHKTGETAMDGTVSDQDQGLGSFTTFRVNGTPVVSCGLAKWEPEKCRVFNDKGTELPLPTYQMLTANIDAGEVYTTDGQPTGKKLKWRPDQCGGYEMKLNFDPLIDYAQDMITVDIHTTDRCKADDYAEMLYCTIAIESGKPKMGRCSTGGGDAGLAGGIADMDKQDGTGDGEPSDQASAPRREPAKGPAKPRTATDPGADEADDGYGSEDQIVEEGDAPELAPAPQSGSAARPQKPLPAHH